MSCDNIGASLFCSAPWGSLRPPGASWGSLGLPGAPWGLLGPPGAPWGSLGLPGASWGLLGPPGAPWGPLGLPGSPWGSLGLRCRKEPFGRSCQNVFFLLCSLRTTPRHKLLCKVAVSSSSWYHPSLSTFGARQGKKIEYACPRSEHLSTFVFLEVKKYFIFWSLIALGHCDSENHTICAVLGHCDAENNTMCMVLGRCDAEHHTICMGLGHCDALGQISRSPAIFPNLSSKNWVGLPRTALGHNWLSQGSREGHFTLN